MLQPLQPDVSADLWVDLLTGDNMPPETISQQVMGTSVHEGGDFLSFLDEAVIEQPKRAGDSEFTLSWDQRPSESNAQQYINCLRVLAGPQMVC